MLVYAFWLSVIIAAVALGIWIGRSSKQSEPATDAPVENKDDTKV